MSSINNKKSLNTKNIFRIFFKILLYLFAIWGVALTGVFFAMKFGLTKTGGTIDKQSEYFKSLYDNTTNQNNSQSNIDINYIDANSNAINRVNDTSYNGDLNAKNIKPEVYCILLEIKNSSQADTNRIVDNFKSKYDTVLLARMVNAYRYSWLSSSIQNSATENNINNCVNKNTNNFSIQDILNLQNDITHVSVLPWSKTAEWGVIAQAIEKDKDIINRVSKETGVSARLLVMPLVVEQLRLFHSDREVFKRYFAPLRVLGAQTQFSLGIYGIKEDTAKQIENNLKNINSNYYLGPQYQNMLNFSGKTGSSTLLVEASSLKPIKSSTTKKSSSTTSSNNAIIATTSTTTWINNTGTTGIQQLNTDSSSELITRLLSGNELERVQRLTSETDHYYSYLYAALYIKQILNSWESAGYAINDRPEIIATIYNLGFTKSNPKFNPQVGGAEIKLGDVSYTFGSLGYQFYYSGLMSEIFPY